MKSLMLIFSLTLLPFFQLVSFAQVGTDLIGNENPYENPSPDPNDPNINTPPDPNDPNVNVPPDPNDPTTIPTYPPTDPTFHFHCPDNKWTNGDFENGIPTVGDEDIVNAVGYSPIWAPFPGVSTADFWNNNFAPPAPFGLANAGPGHGNYGGFWAVNSSPMGLDFREGLMNQLVSPIPFSTSPGGECTLTFDLACLGGNNNAPIELAIVGVFNPGNVLAPPPLTIDLPTNPNLFGAPITSVLETIMVPGCNASWQTLSITFSKSQLPPGGITHIFVAASDLLIPGGMRYVAVDNFCLQCVCEEDAFDSIYCCEDSTENFPTLLENGNFEGGNVGFVSEYVNDPSVFPGQYDVAPASSGLTISPNWNVTDHSVCEGGTGDNVMFVNGLTNQPPFSSSIIWSQTLTGLEVDSTYRFCGYFKHLPQCAFDIMPEITVFGDGIIEAPLTTLIDETDPSDPCSWQLVTFDFTAITSTATINVSIREDGVGDGNDLAMDDFSVHKIIHEWLVFALLTENVNGMTVTASIGALTSTDDTDYGDCDYEWQVITDPNGTPSIHTDVSGLTTDFPGFTFSEGIEYAIVLNLFNCVCATGGTDTIFVMNALRPATNGDGYDRVWYMKLDNGEYEEIQTRSSLPAFEFEAPFSEDGMNIQPNPAVTQAIVSYSMEEGEQPDLLNLLDINGRVLKSMTLSGKGGSVELELSSLPPGQYFVQLSRSGLPVGSQKLIKH